MYIYAYNFQNAKPLRPFQEGIELRHKVILVLSIDETFSTVVHKPTGDICSRHLICSVVFLQASAMKMVCMVRAQANAWPTCIPRKEACFSPLLLWCPFWHPVCPQPRSPCCMKHESLQLHCRRAENKQCVPLIIQITLTEINQYGLFQQDKEWKLTVKWREDGNKSKKCVGKPTCSLLNES